MNTITRKVYTKEDFKTVIIPTWQRWTNNNNITDLTKAVLQCGQIRDILVGITKDGTRFLIDGKHLKITIFDKLKWKKANVLEISVKNEEQARQTFISFNTRGKSLKNIDYVVSYAGSGNFQYKKFLHEVMQNPKNLKDANEVHGKLFTIPALIQIFLGKGSDVKTGKSVLPKQYNRLVEIVDYIGKYYLHNGKIVKHTKDHGKKMKLNGGSIISIFDRLKQRPDLLLKTNKEMLNILIDFTYWHFESMDYASFNKDVVSDSFKVYEQTELK